MNTTNDEITFKKLYTEWLEIKRISIKHSTYIKYKNIIQLHLYPFFEKTDIYDLNELMIANYLLFLNKEKHLSSSSLQSIKYVFKSLYLYGQRQYQLKNINFDFVKIPVEKKLSKVLEEKEETILTNYCIKNANAIAIAIMLGLYAGLRLGEVCALKWEDIDLEEGVIHINKTVQRLENIDCQLTKTKVMIFKPKTQSSYRDVMMPDFLTEYIKKYFALVLLNRNSENHFILSNKTIPSEPRTIQRSFERVCKKSGIMTNFHTLRHTYATNCIKLGIDVKTLSEMLGHSNISTTLNRYVHPSMKFKKNQVNKLKRPMIDEV